MPVAVAAARLTATAVRSRFWPLMLAALADGLGSGACAATGAPDAEAWDCRNDLEVRCGDGGCAVEPRDGFTPMSVHFDAAGAISVCSYSGCWDGVGDVFSSGDFLILAGRGLPFSSDPESPAAAADVLIGLDRSDGIATLKVGAFAQPLVWRDEAPQPSAARSQSERASVLEACAAVFGPPVDPSRGFFEIDRGFVLEVQLDDSGRLQQLGVFPKHWFSDTHPDWDQAEDVGELDETQYESLLRRLDGIYPRGALVMPDEQPVVHGTTLRRRDVYQHAIVTTGDVVDDTAPADALRAIEYVIVSPVAAGG